MRILAAAFALGVSLAGPARGEEPERQPQTISFERVPYKVYGDPAFSLRASASSGLPVSFSAAGDCEASGATVRILSAGRCQLTASQAGDDTFAPAPDAQQTLQIRKASQAIDLREVATKVYLDPDFPLDARASSGLPLVYQVWGSCEVSDGGRVHILGAGECGFTAHQPGDVNYTAAPIVERGFVIEKAEQTISMQPILDRYVLPAPEEIPLTVRSSSGLRVRIDVFGPCAFDGASLHVLAAGTCSVLASQPGDANFNPAPAVGEAFEIVGD